MFQASVAIVCLMPWKKISLLFFAVKCGHVTQSTGGFLEKTFSQTKLGAGDRTRPFPFILFLEDFEREFDAWICINQFVSMLRSYRVTLSNIERKDREIIERLTSHWTTEPSLGSPTFGLPVKWDNIHYSLPIFSHLFSDFLWLAGKHNWYLLLPWLSFFFVNTWLLSSRIGKIIGIKVAFRWGGIQVANCLLHNFSKEQLDWRQSESPARFAP